MPATYTLNKSGCKKLTDLKFKYCMVNQRKNRFVVVVNDGTKIRNALLRNTGRLHDLIYNGSTALCIDRKEGKTDCEIIGALVDDKHAAIIDPVMQTRCFELAVERNLIPWMAGWKIGRREVSIGESRLDYMIMNIEKGSQGYLELKSAAFCDGYHAMYPDCPSERGLRHIRLLHQMRKDGHRSIIGFIAAHPHAEAFRPNALAHAELAHALWEASSAGVEVRAVKIFLDMGGNIMLCNTDLPVLLTEQSEQLR